MTKPPLDSRRRLGAELRRLRLAAQMSGPSLAQALGVGQATVSRMETGQVRPSIDTVQRWLEVTRASPRTVVQVVELAEEAQVDVAGWRHVFRGGMAPQQRAMHQFDATATAIRHFQPFMIPGYFQPAEYAAAAIFGFRVTDKVPDLDEAVAARLERGQLLRDSGTPYHLIVTELGLRMLPDGVSPAARTAAWEEILEASSLPHITVQVMPVDRPVLQVPVCGWVMYDQPADAVEAVIVQVETPAALMTFSGPDVPPFEKAWSRMEAAALSPAESVAAIAQLSGKATQTRRRSR